MPRTCGEVGEGGHRRGGDLQGRRGALHNWPGGGGVLGRGAGPLVWGVRVRGKGWEVVLAVLARRRWPLPKPRRPVLGGCEICGVGVWHWGVRTPDTVGTSRRGWCPGPVMRGFAPGTQSMG